MLVDLHNMEKQPPKTEAKNIPNPVGMDTQMDFLKFLVYAILVVLFIGFAGMFVATSAMLWGAWKDKEGSFNILQETISQQNIQLQILNDRLSIKK